MKRRLLHTPLLDPNAAPTFVGASSLSWSGKLVASYDYVPSASWTAFYKTLSKIAIVSAKIRVSVFINKKWKAFPFFRKATDQCEKYIIQKNWPRSLKRTSKHRDWMKSAYLTDPSRSISWKMLKPSWRLWPRKFWVTEDQPRRFHWNFSLESSLGLVSFAYGRQPYQKMLTSSSIFCRLKIAALDKSSFSITLQIHRPAL